MWDFDAAVPSWTPVNAPNQGFLQAPALIPYWDESLGVEVILALDTVKSVIETLVLIKEGIFMLALFSCYHTISVPAQNRPKSMTLRPTPGPL